MVERGLAHHQRLTRASLKNLFHGIDRFKLSYGLRETTFSRGAEEHAVLAVGDSLETVLPTCEFGGAGGTETV